MAAGMWAALAVPLWLLVYMGVLDLPAGSDGLGWHQHEMLYGFAGAAMAGFILTAIPNWTGRLPVSGGPLAVLAGLWLMGRLAFLMASTLGPLITAIVDLSFLTALALIIAREIIAGANWRNLPVLILISLFCTGNWLIHFEANGIVETADIGLRLSMIILSVLVAVIGGRIVPSFTRNWLVRTGADTRPAAPMGKFDLISLLALVGFAGLYVAIPDHQLTAFAALLAGGLHGFRLLRWKGWAVVAEPLMWVLHLGYSWLALALILIGFSGIWDAIPFSAAIHALTSGAFATMILAVMSRAALGHSGRELAATPAMTTIFVMVTIAAVLRVAAPFLDGNSLTLIWMSGIAWTAAFGLFSVVFYPILTRR